MGVLLLNNNLHEDCENIYNNFPNLNNKFGLSQRDIASILDAKGKQSYEKTNKLLALFNSYYFGDNYKDYFSMEELYNTKNIKEYLVYKNSHEGIYGNENKSNFIGGFLTLIFTAIKSIFKIKGNDGGLKIGTFFLKMILLLLFIIITLRYYNYYHNNTSNLDDNSIKSKYQNIINR